METPLRGRSGGHAGTAPTVSFGWIAHGRLVLFGRITRGRLISFRRIAYGRLALSLRYSARMPLRVLFFLCFLFL
ncbi:hypothetical protein [Segatella oulorum]|uniref:hypothetical protein n=1 Tax=Segatella oulorum TaxID=28136 RepID=UPI0012DD4A02|nr:hypothetical protein [Segatella oulorum]